MPKAVADDVRALGVAGDPDASLAVPGDQELLGLLGLALLRGGGGGGSLQFGGVVPGGGALLLNLIDKSDDERGTKTKTKRGRRRIELR